MPCPSEYRRLSHGQFLHSSLSLIKYTYLNSSHNLLFTSDLLNQLPFSKTPNPTNSKMCLFSTPSKHRRHAYIEETYIAPRPVSRSHHHHHGHGRSSYTSVTRTSRPVSREYITPRMSQNSYRRSGPVVVEQRRSRTSYR